MTRPILIALALSLSVACNKQTPPEAAGAVDAADPGAASSSADGAQQIDPETGMPVPAETPEQRTARLRAQVDDAAALLTSRDAAQTQQAVTLLEESLTELSGESLVYYNLGLAYEQLGELEKSKRSYLQAAELDPELTAAWMNVAAIYMEEEQFGRALRTYRDGLEHDPENMQLRGGVIAAMRELGRGREAIQEAREALTINANSVEIYNNLGLVYLDQGELEMAQFIFEKALFLKGGQDNARLHCNLGIVFLEMDQGPRARASFEKALEKDPNLVPAMFFLSNYYLDNRNFVDTVSTLELARELAPSDHGVRLNLGIGYRGVGRYEDAKREFEAALDLKPDDPSPHLNLGILYGDYMKSYESAVSEYENYKDGGAHDPELVDSYIEATLQEKRKVELLEERRKKLEEDRKKREEAQRLVEEAEAKAAAEEAARQAAEEAAGANQPDGGESGGEGGEAPPEGADPGAGETGGATQDAVRPPEEAPQEGSGGEDADPWGDEPAEEPPAEDPPTDDPPTEDTPPAGNDPWGG